MMVKRNTLADIFWLTNGINGMHGMNGINGMNGVSEKASEKTSKVIKQIGEYYPKKILKSGPCTIVFWQDGTKTMVRRADDEVDNDYSAFTAALAIKIFGSNSAVKRTVKNKLVEQIKKPKNNA